jgi:hypothetical protein
LDADDVEDALFELKSELPLPADMEDALSELESALPLPVDMEDSLFELERSPARHLIGIPLASRVCVEDGN